MFKKKQNTLKVRRGKGYELAEACAFHGSFFPADSEVLDSLDCRDPSVNKAHASLPWSLQSSEGR